MMWDCIGVLMNHKLVVVHVHVHVYLVQLATKCLHMVIVHMYMYTNY